MIILCTISSYWVNMSGSTDFKLALPTRFLRSWKTAIIATIIIINTSRAVTRQAMMMPIIEPVSSSSLFCPSSSGFSSTCIYFNTSIMTITEYCVLTRTLSIVFTISFFTLYTLHVQFITWNTIRNFTICQFTKMNSDYDTSPTTYYQYKCLYQVQTLRHIWYTLPLHSDYFPCTVHSLA